MCIVLDNAPYYHKRVIGSLQSINKKDLLAMMKEDEVDFIDLPWTDHIGISITRTTTASWRIEENVLELISILKNKREEPAL
mmetsp:Transcript_30290/g.37001  ORF Transcript_30290/g.37001 Transcript_30290/m.37001 type:complete len:82 (+) Transcript_30290:110-355(+)